MASSRRTDPYEMRAQRRVRGLPRLCRSRPTPGFYHPAELRDLEQFLRRLGPAAYYGVVSIHLARSPGPGRLGQFRSPSRILLFEQPVGEWLLNLTKLDQERLRKAGAELEVTPLHTRVSWPTGSLRRFMLHDVLLHELGHHYVQQRRRKAGPVCRRRDHERLAGC